MLKLEATFRPVIEVIRLTPDRSCVEVILDLDGCRAGGFADVVDGDTLSAAAGAACAATRQLLPDGHDLVLHWVQRFVHDDIATSSASVVNVAVDWITPERAPEVLLGAALVHHDPVVAAVRAALDGLTRRIAPVMDTYTPRIEHEPVGLDVTGSHLVHPLLP